MPYSIGSDNNYSDKDNDFFMMILLLINRVVIKSRGPGIFPGY